MWNIRICISFNRLPCKSSSHWSTIHHLLIARSSLCGVECNWPFKSVYLSLHNVLLMEQMITQEAACSDSSTITVIDSEKYIISNLEQEVAQALVYSEITSYSGSSSLSRTISHLISSLVSVVIWWFWRFVFVTFFYKAPLNLSWY